MLEDSDFELTLNESELLIVAATAKPFAVAREYLVWPPQSEHEVIYWKRR